MLGFHSISEYPISTIQYITVVTGGDGIHFLYREKPPVSEEDTSERANRIRKMNDQILIIIKAFVTCH